MITKIKILVKLSIKFKIVFFFYEGYSLDPVTGSDLDPVTGSDLDPVTGNSFFPKFVILYFFFDDRK